MSIKLASTKSSSLSFCSNRFCFHAPSTKLPSSKGVESGIQLKNDFRSSSSKAFTKMFPFCIHERPFPKTPSALGSKFAAKNTKTTALDAAVNLPATIVSKIAENSLASVIHETQLCKRRIMMCLGNEKQTKYRLTKLQPHCIERETQPHVDDRCSKEGTHHAEESVCVFRIFFSRQFVLFCGRFLLCVSSPSLRLCHSKPQSIFTSPAV